MRWLDAEIPDTWPQAYKQEPVDHKYFLVILFYFFVCSTSDKYSI